MSLLFSLLLACRPVEVCQSQPLSTPLFAATVIDTSYSSGGLSFGDKQGLRCPVPDFLLSGDTVVRGSAASLFLLERSTRNVVTSVDPQQVIPPRWQTALPTQSYNPHDLVVLDDRLWVPTYEGTIVELSPEDGDVIAVLDVPGSMPALDRAFAIGGSLWIADQRFDRSTWTSTAGALLELNPDDLEIQAIEVGPNPRIRRGRTPSELLVMTGLYATSSEDSRVSDGALQSFSTVHRALSEPLVTESEIRADIHSVIAVNDMIVLITIQPDASSGILCVDSDGGITPGPQSSAWFVEGIALGDNALIAARKTAVSNDATSESGVFLLDPDTCEKVEDLTSPDRDPYDLVALE